MFFYNPLTSSIKAAQASLIGIYSFTLTTYNTAGNLLYNAAAYVYNNFQFSQDVMTGLNELAPKFALREGLFALYEIIDDMIIPPIISFSSGTIEYLNTHPIQTTAMIAISVAVTSVIKENTLGFFCGSSSEELSQINDTNNTSIIHTNEHNNITNECVNSHLEIFTQLCE